MCCCSGSPIEANDGPQRVRCLWRLVPTAVRCESKFHDDAKGATVRGDNRLVLSFLLDRKVLPREQPAVLGQPVPAGGPLCPCPRARGPQLWFPRRPSLRPAPFSRKMPFPGLSTPASLPIPLKLRRRMSLSSVSGRRLPQGGGCGPRTQCLGPFSPGPQHLGICSRALSDPFVSCHAIY